jgi:peptidoglycan/xylan/chitin deacetylase (PgdA/CDA1 family)
MLNTFFDLEKAFWDVEGIEVNGAVVPAHYTTELVKAVCGGRFGVVRSGYDGIVPGTQNPSYTVTNHYSYYTSGEQSNLYALSSYNNSGVTDAYNQAAVDYAQANNKILICYFHENAMDATKWQRVSDMIDYAKTKGLEFITLGDIPYLLSN